MKPLSEFCCINPNCSEYGKRDNINLKVHQTYGKSDPIRLLGVSRDTVIRLTRLAGIHAKSLHDELVNGVEIKEAQADEKWSFVGKKRKRLLQSQLR